MASCRLNAAVCFLRLGHWYLGTMAGGCRLRSVGFICMLHTGQLMKTNFECILLIYIYTHCFLVTISFQMFELHILSTLPIVFNLRQQVRESCGQVLEEDAENVKALYLSFGWSDNTWQSYMCPWTISIRDCHIQWHYWSYILYIPLHPAAPMANGSP